MQVNADALRAALTYESQTGLLRWLVNRGRVKAGDIAGHASKGGGYVRVRVCQRTYLAHRVAWLLHHGEWPTECLDHRNGIRSDNRIGNLREGSPTLNAENVHIARSHNKTGFLGVIPHKDRYRARVKAGARLHHLGTFATPELAHAAYVDAKRRLHAGNTL